MQVISVNYSENISNFKKHYHNAHQILYVSSGEISVTLRNQVYTVRTGQLLVLSCFEEHAIKILTPQYTRYTLRIAPDISQNDVHLSHLSSFLINRPEGFQNVVDVSGFQPQIEQILSAMAREFREQRPMHHQQLQLLLTTFLILLYREVPTMFPDISTPAAQLVNAIQRSFETHYKDTYTIASIAGQYHVSPSHLCHIFKSITGYPLMEYLMNCRLSAAKNMLGETEKTISEIVVACGFSNNSNFSRFFKDRVGMTPSQFRKRYHVK